MTNLSELNKVHKSPPESLADKWLSEPEPIIQGLQHQDKFPIECLPEIIRECVVETCSYTQVPIAFASSTALGVAAASVQHLANVARDDQTVGPISLYVLNILRSGERKSTIHKLFQKGFRDRQAELIKNFKDSSSDSNINDSSGQSQIRLPVILFEDVTMQALSLDISLGEKCALLSSSEGGTIFGGIGMKGENLMGALAFLNKAWDGESQAMTRKQTQSSYIDHYRLSSLISSQKKSLDEWLSKSVGLAEGMGFLARFLICIPRSQIGHRLYIKAPSYTPCLDKFSNSSLDSLRIKTDLTKPRILRLSKNAHEIWVEYFDKIERSQAKDGKYENHTAAASKSAEQAARIAAVFTLFGNHQAERVETVEMERGIRIAEWFLDESMKLSTTINTPKSNQDAEKILKWLKIRQKSSDQPITPRELSQDGPNSLRGKSKRDEVLKILSDKGWVKVIKSDNKNYIQLHPYLMKESSD